MPETQNQRSVMKKPACPECGSSDKVVHMPSSLTPFERPSMQAETGGRWYCQACSHDFEPEQDEE